jgi:type IV secretion system protein VirD4
MSDMVPGRYMGNVVGSDADDALLLGREVCGNGQIGDKVRYGGPLHAVLFGPNGVGKGMRCLVPNLLSIADKSIVVIDPKGQLAAMTAKYRHQAGNDVAVIDPCGVLDDIAQNDPQTYRYLIEQGLVKSVGFNPLGALDPASPTFYDDAAIIVEAMIKLQGNDPHWPESAQGLAAGLVMWDKVRNGDRANLENVRAMLTEADAWETYWDSDAQKYREGKVRGLSVTAACMVAEGGFEIASLGARFLSETPTDEMESVRSTADTQTRWLLSRPMRADLAKSGVDFRRLKSGPRPLTVYVILPSKMLESHSIWLRLVVSEALRASLTPGGWPVLMMLDEFAALGHMQIIERLYPVTRDYKIQMWLILQDLPQLQSLYKDRWETMLGMAGVIQSFRTGDLTTAEWLSKRTGNTTVVAASYQRGQGISGGGSNSNSGLSYQQMQRPTVVADDMFGIKDGYLLTWFAGEQRPALLFAPMFNAYTNTFARWALPNPYYGR